MKTAWNIQPRFHLILILSSLMILSAGCTDRRAAKPYSGDGLFSSGTSNIVQRAQVQVNGAPTTVMAMAFGGGYLNLSGNPFLFARWEITSDPTNPRPIFTASNNTSDFSPDPPFGGWTAQGFASGGMAFLGAYGIVSGDVGLSILQLGPSSAYAREVNRVPGISQGNIVANPVYQYKAIVTNPGGNFMYGFSVADGYYVLDSSRIPQVTLKTPKPIALTSSGNSCCVTAAASFGGKVFVAMRSQLAVYNFGANGALALASSYTSLQASNLAVSTNYLFIQSNATGGGTSSYEDGVYVMNTSGAIVAFLAVNPLSFAVTPDGRFMYTYEGDGFVKIYQIGG